MGVRVGYSCGVDSYRFVIPKSVALKFLKKLDLYSKLRATTRNKQVQMYCKDKFKSLESKNEKYPFKVRYINLMRGVKSLSNTILFLENSPELHALARAQKKKLDYFVMIIFAGLHQPSKDIESCVFGTLAKFIRRFKAHSFDLALDFDSKMEVNYSLKNGFAEATKEWSGGEIISIGKSLYANKIANASKYFNLSKILLYDKYHKQRFYHKEKIPESFKSWRRLELTFSLNAKFLECVENESLNEALSVMGDIGKCVGACGLFGVSDVRVLSRQIQMLLDLRRKHEFKAWIKESA